MTEDMISIGSDGSDKEDQETLDQLRRKLREKLPNGHRIERFDDNPLMLSLHEANASYDRNLPGEAVSERPLIGPAISVIKRFVRKLIRWYVDPAIDSQRKFNADLTRTLNEMKRYLDHLQINEDIMSVIMHRELTLFRTNIMYLNKFLERKMLEIETEIRSIRRAEAFALDLPSSSPSRGEEGHDALKGVDVLALEQKVHGSPKVVTERVKTYLKYLDGCEEVVAIGCGRGEILRVLEKEGYKARGSEMSAVLADYCRDHGLDVVRMDPLSFASSLNDSSVDGIILGRFAGYVPVSKLFRMLRTCREKLKGKGIIIIEAPNPFSLYGIASYAIEYSENIYPLHPETLKLICESSGYSTPEIVFLGSYPPEEHLEDLESVFGAGTLTPVEVDLFKKINENFRRINKTLFSHRDYILVAKHEKGG